MFVYTYAIKFPKGFETGELKVSFTITGFKVQNIARKLEKDKTIISGFASFFHGTPY